MSYAYPMDSILSYDENGVPQYDRAINSAQLRTLYHELLSDGVLLNNSTNLQVVANSTMNVTVKAGLCNIQGCIKKFEEDIDVTIESASTSYNRIDTIVARLDLNSDYRDIGIFVIKGTPASVPTRPELTRDTNVYEIALADITISANATTLSQANISDTRLDTTRCGIISCIAEFDTTKLYEQIQADLKQFQESNEADFEQWFEHMKEQLGEDSAGHLQNQVDDHKAESVPSENGAHGFRFFEGRMQAHIYDEESMTLKWVTVPGSGIVYDGEKSVKGAIDECVRTLGYTVGKNYLPNPIVNNTQYGVSCVVNSNKSVTLNGTNTNVGRVYNNLVGVADKGVYDEIKGLEDNVEYTISGCVGGSETTYGIACVQLHSDGSTTSIDSFDGEVTFAHRKGDKYRCYIFTQNGVTLNNITMFPMIRKASEDDTYEPYVADVQTQLNTIFTSVDYTIQTTSNSLVSPYTRYGELDISSHINAYGTPISINASNSSGIPMPCSFSTGSKKIRVCSNLGEIYTKVVYVKIPVTAK